MENNREQIKLSLTYNYRIDCKNTWYRCEYLIAAHKNPECISKTVQMKSAHQFLQISWSHRIQFEWTQSVNKKQNQSSK